MREAYDVMDFEFKLTDANGKLVNPDNVRDFIAAVRERFGLDCKVGPLYVHVTCDDPDTQAKLEDLVRGFGGESHGVF
jgi:hypothetical protein